MIDLSSLPDPQVIEELDYETILQSFIDEVRDLFAAEGIDYDVGALETDPVKIVLEAFSYREIRLRTRANHVARNQILAYSTGTDLEHLASHYGVARLAGETDERLRERVQLATIGRSPGGTHERFKAIAMASSPKVRDIATWTEDRDPTVNIAVLSTDVGGAASASLLATVRAALEAPAVRLVSDRYNVISAVQKVVAVDLSVTLTPDASEDVLAELPDLIRLARDQENLLGLDLYRAWVSKAAMVSGVSNVVVNAPAADVVASPEEAVKIGDVTVQFAGRGR
ncbi:Baseplate J-like protein [Labrenzia sp. THAF35]|uniref:baseplate J/gp47 family protein n=1 Tax=Labrenzia sp. THAF35 TaxID=2587854 RepID=UPI00126853C3|nr:baseplate J/gp47 family protein [Labrenzia sp. THAF35]QFT69307.1 Baseplate J-like protein [Labrenzia sp. THAF35]